MFSLNSRKPTEGQIWKLLKLYIDCIRSVNVCPIWLFYLPLHGYNSKAFLKETIHYYLLCHTLINPAYRPASSGLCEDIWWRLGVSNEWNTPKFLFSTFSAIYLFSILIFSLILLYQWFFLLLEVPLPPFSIIYLRFKSFSFLIINSNFLNWFRFILI